MASTEAVVDLLKAVNEVTLKRLDVLLGRSTRPRWALELEIQETAALLKAITEVALKRM